MSSFSVDDNPDIARGMVKLLNVLGHDAVLAYPGTQAIQVARQHWPAFVLLDSRRLQLSIYGRVNLSRACWRGQR